MIARIMTDRNAVRKLLTGPAIEVRMSSLTGFLKFRESTGVGLAHPKGGYPSTIRISGMMIVPKGSMCTMGFSETRPSIFAVGIAQAVSHPGMCRLMYANANSSTMTWKKMSTGLA